MHVHTVGDLLGAVGCVRVFDAHRGRVEGKFGFKLKGLKVGTGQCKSNELKVTAGQSRQKIINYSFESIFFFHSPKVKSLISGGGGREGPFFIFFSFWYRLNELLLFVFCFFC